MSVVKQLEVAMRDLKAYSSVPRALFATLRECYVFPTERSVVRNNKTVQHSLRLTLSTYAEKYVVKSPSNVPTMCLTTVCVP